MTQVSQRRRGRPKQESGDTPTPDEILTEAARLFLASGYEGVSVDEVAKHCNVTKATVYYHFHNKSSLFTEAMLRLMERVTARIERILSEDGPLFERLLHVTEQRLRAESQGVSFQTMLHEAKPMLKRNEAEAMRLAEERIAVAIADAIAEGVRSGEIAVEDPYLAAHAYIAMISLGRAEDGRGQLLFGNEQDAAKMILQYLWYGFAGHATPR